MDNATLTYVFIFSIVLEILTIILINNKSKISVLVSFLSLIITTYVATNFLLFEFSTITVIFMIVSLFRIVNISRVADRRMNYLELSKRYTRSVIWLSVFSMSLLLFINNEIYWLNITVLLYLSLLGSIILFFTTIYSMFRWRNRRLDNSKITHLPTVSICIPARNETQDLPECIELILASTYTKLEILVLDDCSHDKTPAVIKDYAHRGVRFIKGQEPGGSWIAKNSAMNKLFEESRGELVVFAGVDVRFSPNTVHNIIEQLEYGLLDMISILPQRKGKSEFSVFIQPIRYWWELSVPRLFGKRPPALSTIWAIRRKKLIKVGGFESVKKSVRPEAHFAKRLNDSYRFVISGAKLGISSIKAPREQLDTALRMRYPQARRRPESVLLIITVEVIIFLVPLLALISGIVQEDSALLFISLLNITILTIANIYISSLTVQKFWIIGVVSLPFLLLEEWYILIRSMFAYEFGTVRWKERNICLPMLAVEKELPKI
jgi:chlorobactene glucosyltransferase